MACEFNPDWEVYFLKTSNRMSLCNRVNSARAKSIHWQYSRQMSHLSPSSRPQIICFNNVRKFCHTRGQEKQQFWLLWQRAPTEMWRPTSSSLSLTCMYWPHVYNSLKTLQRQPARKVSQKHVPALDDSDKRPWMPDGDSHLHYTGRPHCKITISEVASKEVEDCIHYSG